MSTLHMEEDCDDGDDRRYTSMLEKQTLDLLEHLSRMQTEHASLDEHYRLTIRTLEQANKKLRRESALLRGYSTYSDDLGDNSIRDAPIPMTPQRTIPLPAQDDPEIPLTPPDSSNKSHARHKSCPSCTQQIAPVIIPRYGVQTNSNQVASRWIIAGWTAVYIRYLLVLLMALITRALVPPPSSSSPTISKIGKSLTLPRRSRTLSSI